MAEADQVVGLSSLRAFVHRSRPEIVARYGAGLRAAGNPLGRASDADLHEVVGPLLDVLARPGAARDSVGEDVGRSRAIQQVNPVHSLEAASVLYDVTTDVVVDGAAERGVPAVELARLLRELHAVILHRVGEAAIPYAGVLLGQISQAHAAERGRIARDLHDRSAHALALAFQQLEIRRIRVERGDVEGAEGCLDVLRTQLQDAAEMIRTLAQDLGSDHTRDGLAPALRAYVAASGADRVTLLVDDAPAVAAVPAWVREQAFLSIREAVRNALLHSGSDSITVRVGVRSGTLAVVVRDRGVGLPTAVPTGAGAPGGGTSGSGLRSMRERVEQLGGSVTVESRPGAGTTVELLVPLP